MSHNSSERSELWLVKLETEQVRGPYSTEAVGKMILEGIFNGQEEIASYPHGEWKSLSKQPEFYETLLESLENPTERDEKKAQKMDAETIVRPAQIHNFPGTGGDVDEDQTQFPVESVNQRFGSELKKLLQQDEVIKQKKDLQLTDPKTKLSIKQNIQYQIEKDKIVKQRKEILQTAFPKFIFAVFILVGLGIYFLTDSGTSNTAWSLVTPNLNKSDLDPAEAKEMKITAISLLKGGVLDDLIKAQNVLVSLVEGQKNDLEGMGLLCVVYHSMWPYTKQVSNDLKAVATVVQHARQVNPLSSYSDACQAVNLLVKGQINDGRAVLEKALDQNNDKNFILYPFLYLAKGELLEESGNLANAEAYYNEALKQFPGWIRADYYAARVLYRQNKYPQAIEIFERILSKNENYKAALYGLGLSVNKMKGDSSGKIEFEKGYGIKQTIPKDVNLEALQEYAQILVEQKQSKKALEVVQAALKISPTHRALKDLFTALGGESLTIEDAQVTELIIEGDQFFRLGDYLAAQGRYRTAFDNDPKNALLALKIAKSMRALNQFRESISWIDTAIKIDPKMFQAYSLKADYLIQRYNFSDAQAALIAGQKIDSNNYEILKSLARLEWKKNNLDQALAGGLRAYKQYNVDVELLTLLANINIDLFFRPSRSGDTDNKDKITYLENAQKYAARAVDLEPAWPESQITYAKYQYAKNGTQSAENYYQELIKSFPYTLDYQIALAEFYELLERNNAAQEIYQRVVEIDPKNIKANLGMARSFRSRNDFNSAIKYFMVSASLDPSDVDPMFSVGKLQLEMAENETKAPIAEKLIGEALARFELVKKNNSNYPKVYYFTAKAKLALGQYDEAMEDINTEKNKNPNLADPYILSAEINQRLKQYAHCAQNYTTVIKLRPTSEFYFKAAACHRLAGSLDLAEDMINEGHVRESGNYTYYRELGYLYEARGDKQQARKNFENYLDLTARNSFDAKEIENKLRSL